MDKVSTLFLKIAVCIIGLPVLIICIFLVPALGRITAQIVPDFAFLQYVVMGIFYASAIPFYMALYQAFQLLRHIDRKMAFSPLAVRPLKCIKHYAVIISILHLLTLPMFYIFAELDDAPGVIFVGLIVPFASFVIAVFAAVLQKLLQEAVDIKSENDLMI